MTRLGVLTFIVGLVIPGQWGITVVGLALIVGGYVRRFVRAYRQLKCADRARRIRRLEGDLRRLDSQIARLNTFQ